MKKLLALVCLLLTVAGISYAKDTNNPTFIVRVVAIDNQMLGGFDFPPKQLINASGIYHDFVCQPEETGNHIKIDSFYLGYKFSSGYDGRTYDLSFDYIDGKVSSVRFRDGGDLQNLIAKLGWVEYENNKVILVLFAECNDDTSTFA